MLRVSSMASFRWFVTMYILHLVRCSIVDTKNAKCYVPTEQCNALRQKKTKTVTPIEITSLIN